MDYKTQESLNIKVGLNIKSLIQDFINVIKVEVLQEEITRKNIKDIEKAEKEVKRILENNLAI